MDSFVSIPHGRRIPFDVGPLISAGDGSAATNRRIMRRPDAISFIWRINLAPETQKAHRLIELLDTATSLFHSAAFTDSMGH